MPRPPQPLPTTHRPSPPRLGRIRTAKTPGIARAAADLQVVLRVRVDEKPVAVDAVTAMCVDLRVDDDPQAIVAAHAAIRARGLEVRCRTPEIVFDADQNWWLAVAELPWDVVQARHPAGLSFLEPRPGLLIEYPLQGLNALAARDAWRRRHGLQSRDVP